jgi:hypothetical protein
VQLHVLRVNAQNLKPPVFVRYSDVNLRQTLSQ